MLEFHIACPMYNYSNIATTSTPKYKVVYQPSNDNEGKIKLDVTIVITVLTSTGVLDTPLWKTMQRVGNAKWHFYSFLYSYMA